jgi:hypothetical protein
MPEKSCHGKDSRTKRTASTAANHFATMRSAMFLKNFICYIALSDTCASTLLLLSVLCHAMVDRSSLENLAFDGFERRPSRNTKF